MHYVLLLASQNDLDPGPPDYTGNWITFGGSALAALLLLVGTVVARRMRGATPYDQLAARVTALETSAEKSGRHVRLLSHALDIMWRLNERVTSGWGVGETPPQLSKEDQEVVQMARDLQTYGDINNPNEKD